MKPSKARALRRIPRVLAIRARERIGPPRELRGGEIPPTPEQISPQWLTMALCARTPGASVREVRWLGGSAGTTTRTALDISYDEIGTAAALPTRLFVKCTATAAQRLMLGLGGFIEGEPGFYNHVRPALAIEAPAGYFAGVDHRTWRSIVVIEDVVATRGARFWTTSTKLARPQLENLLSNVARLHAALWNSPRLGALGWLRAPADHARLVDALIGMADRTGVGFERARSVIPVALHARQRDLYIGMQRSMQLASEGPQTYLHGDLHIANTYLTSGGTIGVADWQIGLKGCWAHDLAYLLSTAVEVDERRATERELLDLYLASLAPAGGPGLSEAEAWEAYRRALLYPYFAWIYTIGRSRLQPRFQPDEVSITLIRRITAAIEDLDALGAVGL